MGTCAKAEALNVQTQVVEIWSREGKDNPLIDPQARKCCGGAKFLLCSGGVAIFPERAKPALLTYCSSVV